MYPVWFNQLQFLFDRATTWQLHFVWEYFEDYQWVQIGGEYNKSYKTTEDPYLGHVMSFNQDIPFRPGNKKHVSWRIKGKGGMVTSSAYINVLFNNLT